MQERDLALKQIDRLVACQALHSSESLCRLLRYLAAFAFEHPDVHPKEYQIAVEAFGRPPDFDPQTDSTIRVQAGRLRQKLVEYYAEEGAEDPIVVELPKGSYALTFHHRNRSPAHTHANGGASSAAEPRAPQAWLRGPVISLPALAGVAVLVAVVASLTVYAFLRRAVSLVPSPSAAGSQLAVAAAHADPLSSAALRELWASFLADPGLPLVVYSNARFVGRPETGLRYFKPGVDSPDHIFDQYTGIGEVMAIHNLDSLFEPFHRQIVVKRGELFTLDDAQNNNLIFVGSPSENLILREIPGTEEFVFRRFDSGPHKNDLALVNLHPGAGEQPTFLASPSGEPMTHDYAVVALMRGINPAHWVMILAGTTTFGTQGAVQFVCQENLVRNLLLRLSVAPNGQLAPFEALLHVKVTNGVPVEESVVSLRERPSQ